MKKNNKHESSKIDSETENTNEQQVNFQSIKLGYTIIVLLSIVISIIKSFNNQSLLDMLFIVCSSASAIHLYRYFKIKNIQRLLRGIITAITAVFFLIMFCIGY